MDTIVIRKLLSVILGILSLKNSLSCKSNFLIKENLTLPRFLLLVSYETCREEKLSDKWSFVRRSSNPIWTQEEMPFAIDSISTRICYLIIEGWAFVTVSGFLQAPKLLLLRLLENLTPLRARNEMSYDYFKEMKAGESRSFLIRSLWGSRAISIHPLTNTPCTKEEKYGLPAEINASKTTKQNP